MSKRSTSVRVLPLLAVARVVDVVVMTAFLVALARAISSPARLRVSPNRVN